MWGQRHQISTFLVVAGLGVSLGLMSSLDVAAQETADPPSEDASNPCRVDDALQLRQQDESTQRGQDRIKRNLELVRGCNIALIQRAKRLLSGDLDPATNQDGFNRDLQSLIDGFSDTMKEVSGPGGSVELGKRVLSQLDRQIEAAGKDGNTAEIDSDLQQLGVQRDRLNTAITNNEKEIKLINDEILSIIALRPEIAKVIRREEQESYIEDLEGLTEILGNTREEMETIRRDVGLPAATSN